MIFIEENKEKLVDDLLLMSMLCDYKITQSNNSLYSYCVQNDKKVIAWTLYVQDNLIYKIRLNILFLETSVNGYSQNFYNVDEFLKRFAKCIA